jgi:ribosomal protein S18 acetylase RimI-like enzyme
LVVDSKNRLEVRIVAIAEEHIEGFHSCLDSVARERRWLAFLQAPPIASAREFVRANIAQGVPQFVALSGEQVVGWCDVLPRGLPTLNHCGTLGMGVRKGYRRQGIGERLAARTIAEAKELGLERIELEVYASNVPAIRLYEKMGFGVEGVKKRACRIDGRYDDVVDMALFLGGAPLDAAAQRADGGTPTIRKVKARDRAAYLRMRLALYSGDDPQVIEQEMDKVLGGDPAEVVAIVLDRSDGGLGGFLEAHAVPVDLANSTHLVGYVGSLYVDPDLRRMGHGSALLDAGEDWAREQGFTEMRSDCYVANAASYAAHVANGYRETERLIVFSKPI